MKLKRGIFKFGFSLVELLVALIAISCILAAFAPVMTKKVSSKLAVGGGSSETWDGVLFTYNPSDPACTVSEGGGLRYLPI